MSSAPTHDAPRPHLTLAACADPPDDENLLKAAARLSVDTGVAFLPKPVKKGVDALLVAAPGRLELRMIGGDPITRGGRPVCVDLSAIDISSGAGKRLKQPLAKALGIKTIKHNTVVIDATGGWGEDAWLMAGLGCRVLTLERNKIVATLLRDGLLRAAMENLEVAMRVTLLNTNAIHLLKRIAYQQTGHAHNVSAIALEDLPSGMDAFFQPDVVYLDPMFPPRTKGAEGKPMKVLRQLVGDDDDSPVLFEAALKVAKKRVVVKRPLRAEPLTLPGKTEGEEPKVTFKGKSLRYDVYVVGK